jgi:leader peptidase (prepilin peptidase)/N-methyltransferase
MILVFLIGAAVGSFLNVAISRLPLEKSLLWPSSRCGNCYQHIRWYDNLPLVSYLWLRGRCRTCGVRFSIRYFLVELVTGLGFLGLFYLEVVINIHDWPFQGNTWNIRNGFFPWQWWVGFVFHAILFSFLLAASVCDLDGREIPAPLTLTGAVVGLIGAVLLPWPWPSTPQAAVPKPVGFGNPWMDGKIGQGIYPWPVWGPLPDFLAPGGNWQTGLATGLVGFLMGTFLLRGVGFLFSKGLGRDALGLGDADLMMMAGCFLGWQPIVVAFFISVVPALFFGIFNLVIRKDDSLPYGPSLAAGLMITLLTWRWLGPYLQPLFFWGTLLLVLAGIGATFMLGSSYLLRLARGGSQKVKS